MVFIIALKLLTGVAALFIAGVAGYVSTTEASKGKNQDAVIALAIAAAFGFVAVGGLYNAIGLIMGPLDWNPFNALFYLQPR